MANGKAGVLGLRPFGIKRKRGGGFGVLGCPVRING